MFCILKWFFFIQTRKNITYANCYVIVVDEFDKSFDGALVKIDLIRDPSEFCAYNKQKAEKHIVYV